MIDPFDKGTIDIFAEEFWHPANRPERQKEIPQKEKLAQPEEKRAALKNYSNMLDVENALTYEQTDFFNAVQAMGIVKDLGKKGSLSDAVEKN